MQLKRKFYGIIPSTGEFVVIEDWRKVIDTTTQHNVASKTQALGDKPFCQTSDGREVRCNNDKYVNVDRLEGDWEILVNGKWIAVNVSNGIKTEDAVEGGVYYTKQGQIVRLSHEDGNDWRTEVWDRGIRKWGRWGELGDIVQADQLAIATDDPEGH